MTLYIKHRISDISYKLENCRQQLSLLSLGPDVILANFPHFPKTFLDEIDCSGKHTHPENYSYLVHLSNTSIPSATMDSDKAQASAPSGDGNTITRCIINNCTITNSCVNRSTLSDCVLSKTEDVSRSTGQKSQFHDAASVERSDIINSTLQSQSSVHRSTVGQSVIQDQSAVKRSVVTGTTVSRSQIERATLTNCVVAECVIERSDFQGLVLKYGIWKRNELVGKTGDHDPIVIRNHGSDSGAGVS